MADEAMENAKKRLEEDNKMLEASRAQYAERMKGKPTPTQQENDLAALGAHITEHEADGSDPDPNVRHFEASKASGTSTGSRPQTYQTRAHKAEST